LAAIEQPQPYQFTPKRQLADVDYDYKIVTTPVCIKECPKTQQTTVDCRAVSNGGIVTAETPAKGINTDQCGTLFNQSLINEINSTSTPSEI
jgi:hypothetical protein